MARRRSLVLAGTAGLAAAVAAPPPAPVLQIENTARGRTLSIAIGRGESFSVTSQHSMYDQPVTEEFAVDAAGRIVLTAVSSPSAAVREYLGITSPGERHPMHRAMPEIVFRVAAGTPQRLCVRGVERSFLSLGQHGDRLVMRAVLIEMGGRSP